MMNISQPYSGNFFYAEWLEYDLDTKEYKTPIAIRYRPQEMGSSDVSATTNEQILVFENNKKLIKYRMTITTLENNDYKPIDKIRTSDGIIYTIMKSNHAKDSIMAIGNLMFPNQKNVPTVLTLGSE